LNKQLNYKKKNIIYTNIFSRAFLIKFWVNLDSWFKHFRSPLFTLQGDTGNKKRKDELNVFKNVKIAV